MCAVAAYLMLTAVGGERPVGFQLLQASDKTGNAMAVGIWYPTDARPWPTTPIGLSLMSVARNGAVKGSKLPLVVISHGNGAGLAAHADLALALASQGYVVAAPIHNGDNFQDQSGVGKAAFFNQRSQEYLAAVEHLLTRWEGKRHLDADRVGAYGMSMGGFTVLTAIGAQPDLRAIATHCAQAKEFACDVLRHFRSPYAGAQPVAGMPFAADARIKAAVLAAPGLGFTMNGSALDGVQVPIQLWVGERDDKVRDPGPVRQLKGVEYHAVGGAGHLSFLAPCGGLLRPPAMCADADGFDRAAFHRQMNGAVVAFFDQHLKAK